MTTMDSDSESQDSDEGRRFRFEATRKDSLAGLHSRKRRSSPAKTVTRRRSRSFDRNNRDRRNSDRPRQDDKKTSRRSSDAKRCSRDGDTRNSKETGDLSRCASRYKDSKDPKNSSNSLLNHRESKSSRDSPSKSSRRSSKTRERDRRRSKERSTDRNHDEKKSYKYTEKTSCRRKWHSRERSRERSHQENKSKSATEIGRSSESTRKSLLNDGAMINVKDFDKNVEETHIRNEIDSISRLSTSSSRPECKDLNLSDFDIVSDVEGNSSNDSEPGHSASKEIKTRDEIKKRVSKQQYERLLKRQAVKNRRTDEINKVKAKNGGHESATGNNNRSAVSNISLGNAVPTTKITEKLDDLMDDSNVRRKETSECLSNHKDSNESDNSQSNASTYGPLLPGKNSKSSSRSEEKIISDVSPSRDGEKIVPRIVGPILPDHMRQRVGSCEIDAEDTFGPALPPHLERHKGGDRDSQDESVNFPVSTGATLEKEDCPDVDRAESEQDDIDMMGPLPADHPALENDFVQQQLELRARRLKAELAACDIDDENKREEWMIELPPAQSVNLGLGPRKFRVRPAPDMSDRSSWTDTPADRARKRMEKCENRKMTSEPAISRERDATSASSEKEKSKKRQESLVEIHQKKLHKKKKKEEKEAKKFGKTVERRPFDRDIDLQANRFDEARKKSMMSKARHLDDRFSRGKM